MFILILDVGAVLGQEVASAPQPQSSGHSRAVVQARELVRQWLADDDLPGVSAAVGIGGDLVWAEGFGLADLEQQVPVSPSTRFRIGSVSKSLTSAAVGILYERGRLDLDVPIQEYVPDFPKKRWPICLRQLMGNVSGIRDYRDEEEMLSTVHYDSILESLQIFAADSLLFQPETSYQYSTFAWDLVSAAVESAAGESFLEFMQREVFVPAGMQETVPDFPSTIVSERANFYQMDADGHLRNAAYVDQSDKWAGGGFLSTPSDLVRFGFAMLDGKLLEPTTVDLLWTPLQLESGKSTRYGLGWFVRKLGDQRVIGHGGKSMGSRTSFMIFPETRMVVAVMTNVTEARIARVAITLARLFDPTGK